MAFTFARTVIDKAEEFFPVVVEHFKTNVTNAMSKSLEVLRTEYPKRHEEVSNKWREIVAAVEPHLYKANSIVPKLKTAGSHKKRTTRRRKHRVSK